MLNFQNQFQDIYPDINVSWGRIDLRQLYIKFLYRTVLVFLHVHTCICLEILPLVCVSPCVCSAMAWGSICVRLTLWERLPAGSPGGPKSSGRPEAWNPRRPGQMSFLFSLTQPSVTSLISEDLLSRLCSQNADQTVARASCSTSQTDKLLANFLEWHLELELKCCSGI